MGKTFSSISQELRAWIAEQRMFFVATAPLSAAGHVNCSPKGGDTFRVVGEREVAYLDLTGSGVETIAHVQENRRIVILFCAFIGPPRIVRLHGHGEAIYPADPRFPSFSRLFPALPGTRAVIRIDVRRISDSCGLSVPFYNFVAPRDMLDDWARRKGELGLGEYRRQKNLRSIDGLGGFPEAEPGATDNADGRIQFS